MLGKWWANPELEQLTRPCVGLALGWVEDGAHRESVATGSIVVYENTAFWVTAGHVLNDIKQLMNRPGVSGLNAGWIDGLTVLDADRIPVDLSALIAVPLDRDGVDVGVVPLSTNEFRCLNANCENAFLLQKLWDSTDTNTADGYWVVGFPDEFTVLQSREKRGAASTALLRSRIIGLPIEHVEPPREGVCSEFTANDHAFYGRLVDEDLFPGQPQNIEGMSGGPVFSVRRTPEGTEIGLCGVQSAWLSKRRIVRATPMCQVEVVLRETARYIAENKRRPQARGGQ